MSKSPSAAPKLLTAEETAALAGRLTGQPCTPRQVRYLLVTGGLGTDVEPGRQGLTRMFGLLDVAFVRTMLALKAEGLSTTVARAVLTYLRNDIILAWRGASPFALAVRGLRGTLEPVAKGRPKGAAAWVPLREMWRELETEMAKVRTAQPTVWMWRDVPAQVAAGERGRTMNR